MQAPRLAADGLAESLRVEAVGLWAEVLELLCRLIGGEQPDAGPLLLRVLREHELRAALELERERGRLRPFSPACRYFRRPAVIRWIRRTCSPSSVGRAAACRAARRRGACGPQARRGVGRTSSASRCAGPGLRDRERGDRVGQLAAPGFISGSSGIYPDGSAREGSIESAGSGGASGTSRSLRIGERTTGSRHRGAGGRDEEGLAEPICSATTPPSAAPSGIVPQYMKRTTEFIRPCRRCGVSSGAA